MPTGNVGTECRAGMASRSHCRWIHMCLQPTQNAFRLMTGTLMRSQQWHAGVVSEDSGECVKDLRGRRRQADLAAAACVIDTSARLGLRCSGLLTAARCRAPCLW